MVLDCRQLFAGADTPIVIQATLDFSDREFFGCQPFSSPVYITGSVSSRAGVVTLEFQAKTVLQLSCDRCLTEFQRPFSVNAIHVLVQETNLEEIPEDYLLLSDGMLDLDEVCEGDLFLELPSKFLCSPECKGLCQKCGTNLNKGACQCEHKQIDPRLEVLKKLLD